MKLFYSPTSPYVRKVLACAIETGLRETIELIDCNPNEPDSTIGQTNPIGKIPALIAADGAALFDSRVICEHLDGLHDGAKLFPSAGAERWQALRWMALGDGILDAAVLRMYERRRAESERSRAWDARQKDKVVRILDYLEATETAQFGVPMNVGLITLACALGYLDFRFADEDWRPAHGTLAAWYAAIAQQPLIAETAPFEPS